MMLVAFSVNGVPIRLTKERLKHIYKAHPEMQDKENEIIKVLNKPDLVQQGDVGSLLAIKKFDKTPVSNNKYLAVAYRELSQIDGFVLTAFYSSKLKDRKIIWKS